MYQPHSIIQKHAKIGLKVYSLKSLILSTRKQGQFYCKHHTGASGDFGHQWSLKPVMVKHTLTAGTYCDNCRPVNVTHFLCANVRVMSGSDDRSLRLWDIASETELIKYTEHEVLQYLKLILVVPVLIHIELNLYNTE